MIAAVTASELAEALETFALLRGKRARLAVGLARLERMAERVGGEVRLSHFDRNVLQQIRQKIAVLDAQADQVRGIIPAAMLPDE